MKKINATQVKNQFGQLLDEAQIEPVAIQKNGRDIAVVISMTEYQSLIRKEPVRDMIKKYHEESIEKYRDVYAKLAK